MTASPAEIVVASGQRALLEALTEEQAAVLKTDWVFWARPEQCAPEGAWLVWLLLAGRGFGKTRSGAEWVRERVEHGRVKRVALVAPTAADARDVMVEGDSGILATAVDSFRPRFEPSKRRLTWPNGAIATCFSADEPERLRGPQHDAAWCDELAAWRYEEAWHNLMLGLRRGDDPRCVVTTTPKPVRLVRALIAAETTRLTRGATRENARNLAPAFLEAIVRRYEGTRLGRQELEAEMLEDTPGALWTRAMLEREGARVTDLPTLVRVVVAIDPAASANEGSDETGIIVAGIAADGHGYVLEDLSGRYSPHAWAARALEAYRNFNADRIVAEVNNGGDMVDRTNAYNPDVVEVQDDASVNAWGLKTAGKKQFHLFCDRSAALTSAQLQLGRQQAINSVAFTVDRRFILLDPMDIIAITDPVTYPTAQWVRIREITENDDRTLSIVAEEYQQGTGTAARYNSTGGGGGIGGAGGAGPYQSNTAVDPGDALAPVIIDLPTQLVGVLATACALATNGGANWGGAQVWISSDDTTFTLAGTMTGGTTMGTLTATFASGSDPDTTDTLAVDLTPSRGSLLPGSTADADAGNTACYVGGEFVSYSAATLTAQYKYSMATYLRRGQYGSAIAAHAAGSSFVRLRAGTLFQLPYAPGQIGQTIYVKLLSFNVYGGGLQSLDEVSSYAHTIGGAPPSLAALNVPAATNVASDTSSAGTATTSGVTMAAATITISSGTTTISLSTALGAGVSGATSATITLKRGATTIYTSAAYALPASGNVAVAFNIPDPTPGSGSVAYSAVITTNAGTAPFAASTLVVVGLTG